MLTQVPDRYGGILERGSREHTLDDFWSIQLDKMDGYVCLKPLLIDIMDGGEESSSDDDGEDDDEEEDDEMDEDGEEQMVEQNIEEDVADDEEVKNAEAAKRREASDQAQKVHPSRLPHHSASLNSPSQKKRDLNSSNSAPALPHFSNPQTKRKHAQQQIYWVRLSPANPSPRTTLVPVSRMGIHSRASDSSGWDIMQENTGLKSHMNQATTGARCSDGMDLH